MSTYFFNLVSFWSLDSGVDHSLTSSCGDTSQRKKNPHVVMSEILELEVDGSLLPDLIRHYYL